jgi:threonine dehydrogenase-like Zn-dependent dehydrogenase
VVNGAKLAQVFPGETAAVLGGGPIGQLYTALLKLAGCQVITVEPTEERRQLATTMGADRVVDPRQEDLAVSVRDATAGLGADVVIDAVGSQLPNALDVVRKAGRIVLFGMNERARSEIAQVRITRDELQLLGGFIGQETLVFPPAIRLLEQGRLNLEPLVTHQIQLKELPAAIEELRAGRATKVEVVGFA